MATSVFADASQFDTWEAELTFSNRIYGGIPKDPEVLLEHLRRKLGIDDVEELRQRAVQIARERGLDIPEGASYEDAVKMAQNLGDMKGNGFRANGHGLTIGAYQVKAALKESANIVYVGQRLGQYARKNRSTGNEEMVGGKIAKSYMAERIWVDPDDIHLERVEPDGTELVIGHVMTPQGERSILTYYDFCYQPVVGFNVSALAGAVTDNQWVHIWQHAEKNGIGSVRSMGHGRFVVTKWNRIT